MAVNPLYNTKDGLLLKIRLKSSSSDMTDAVIDMAISKVRLGFIDSLGSDRAFLIAGYSPSENPETEEEVLYSRASTAEGLWVTAFLYDLLPTLFMESESESRQNFNDEPLSRDAKGLQKAKDALMAEVSDLLGRLQEPVNEDAGYNKSFSTGRETPFLIFENHPGRSI
jgi:hypothetical protein